VSEQPQHRPGDIANGHVLMKDGTWLPLHPARREAAQPTRRMSAWAKLGMVLGTGFLLFVGCGALIASVGDVDATDPDTATSAAPSASAPQAMKVQPAPSEPAADDNPRISQGLSANDAPNDVELGQAKEPDAIGVTYLPVNVHNHSSKRSTYYIEVSANDSAGQRIDFGNIVVIGLEPDDGTTQQIAFTNELPQDVQFTVIQVQRTASV
jgi:hypothetical protein